ncbi:hypothetical protein F4808DRAFT_358338 [Astrocystis sublimbata]|nr:hypothetical protein F4808DRAFT_358338 [Astrocystis sublimbata]
MTQSYLASSIGLMFVRVCEVRVYLLAVVACPDLIPLSHVTLVKSRTNSTSVVYTIQYLTLLTPHKLQAFISFFWSTWISMSRTLNHVTLRPTLHLANSPTIHPRHLFESRFQYSQPDINAHSIETRIGACLAN